MAKIQRFHLKFHFHNRLVWIAFFSDYLFLPSSDYFFSKSHMTIRDNQDFSK